MTPPPLLSCHAKHGKFAKRIISVGMPKYEKRGGGVTPMFLLSRHDLNRGKFVKQFKNYSLESVGSLNIVGKQIISGCRNMKKEVVG